MWGDYNPHFHTVQVKIKLEWVMLTYLVPNSRLWLPLSQHKVMYSHHTTLADILNWLTLPFTISLMWMACRLVTAMVHTNLLRTKGQNVGVGICQLWYVWFAYQFKRYVRGKSILELCMWLSKLTCWCGSKFVTVSDAGWNRLFLLFFLFCNLSSNFQ